MQPAPHGTIVPSRLYKLKYFESHDAYIDAQADGRMRCDRLCTQSLEEQVNAWVDTTKNLIVGMGPCSVVRREIPQGVVEIRTLTLTYVPAVEQSNVKLIGETQPGRPAGPEVGHLSQSAQHANPAAAAVPAQLETARGDRRRPLRVPEV